MHYKDGTPAKLGDIIQHDTGKVGVLIGGQVGNDFCATSALWFNSPSGALQGAAFVGVLRNEQGVSIASASVVTTFDTYTQTRECVKIGHVDIGHG
jgi:hypothetical protein